MNIKTSSIKGKLDIELIAVLIVILVSLIVSMVTLSFYGLVLTPEAYAQIIAAVATLLAVVLTLGLRLIDDTLNRYEKFVQPKIRELGSFLAGNSVLVGSVKSAFSIFNPVVFQGMIQGLTNSSLALKKHGQFLFTKLYPNQLVTQALEICVELKKLLALIDEVNPYWTETENYEFFLESLILGHIDYSKKHGSNISNEGATAISKRVMEKSQIAEREKPKVVSQIRKLREEILQEIDTVTIGLDSFLEAN